LIIADVAPLVRLVKIFERLGIPPGTPTFEPRTQLIRLDEGMIVAFATKAIDIRRTAAGKDTRRALDLASNFNFIWFSGSILCATSGAGFWQQADILS
jgi:hypothetical protein